MLTVLLVGGMSAATAQSLYQPGFQEFWDSYGYGTGSVEFNRRFTLWQPGAAVDSKRTESSRYTVRSSVLSDRPVSAVDDYGMPVWRDFASDELTRDDVDPSIEAFVGFRKLESRNALAYTVAFTTIGTWNASAGEPAGYTGFPTADDNFISHDRHLSDLQLGPHAGITLADNWGPISGKLQIASMVSYHRREFEEAIYVQRQFSSWLSSSGSDHFQRNSEEVSYAAELRLSGSYWLSERARLNATWSNVYLSTIYYPAEQFLSTSGWSAPAAPLPDNGRDGWVDLLQLSFIVTR